jgi:hypothetical protein
MPLARHDSTLFVDAWGVNFKMVEPGGVAIQCTVTRGALDKLVEGYGETTQSGQIIIFEQWRAAIERVASEIYDAGGIEYGMVVVGPGDVAQIRAARHP